MKSSYEQLSRRDLLQQKSSYLYYKIPIILLHITVFIVLSQIYLLQYLKIKANEEKVFVYVKKLELTELNAVNNKLISEHTILEMKSQDFKDVFSYRTLIKSNLNDNKIKVKNRNEELKKQIESFKHYQYVSESVSLLLQKKEIAKIESLSKCRFDFTCYRLSRNGLSTKEFHLQCDGLLPTVTVIKTSFDILYIGFTNKSWDGNGEKYDSDAFLYSINFDKVHYVNYNTPAIRTSPNLFPSFGENDIYLSETNCFYQYPLHSYSIINGDVNNKSQGSKISISLEEIEVIHMKCGSKGT